MSGGRRGGGCRPRPGSATSPRVPPQGQTPGSHCPHWGQVKGPSLCLAGDATPNEEMHISWVCGREFLALQRFKPTLIFFFSNESLAKNSHHALSPRTAPFPTIGPEGPSPQPSSRQSHRFQNAFLDCVGRCPWFSSFPLKKKKNNPTTLRCLWTSLWLLTNQFSREGDICVRGTGVRPPLAASEDCSRELRLLPSPVAPPLLGLGDTSFLLLSVMLFLSPSEAGGAVGIYEP